MRRRFRQLGREWRQLTEVESALSAWVPGRAPAGLGEAMRYGVLDGGKRLRPLLVLAAAQAVDGDREAALRAACAVELIHAYSLVHDDMPCMDNDVLRRGKPTVHVQFGEAQAMLAGDAMQALAFEVLTPDDGRAPCCRPAVLAAGPLGRPRRHGRRPGDRPGQHRGPLDEQALRDMHHRKTGVLLQASVLMGAACGDGATQAWQALADYGDAVGLAFQVVDDILDVTQASECWARPPARTGQQQADLRERARPGGCAPPCQRNCAKTRTRRWRPAAWPRRSRLSTVLADKVVERDN
jgi:farnesyl diphosphate synthase